MQKPRCRGNSFLAQVVLHHECRMPWPLANRDYVYYKRVAKEADRCTFVMRDVPPEAAALLAPPREGVVRAGNGRYIQRTLIVSTASLAAETAPFWAKSAGALAPATAPGTAPGASADESGDGRPSGSPGGGAGSAGGGGCLVVLRSSDDIGGRVPTSVQRAAAAQAAPNLLRKLETAATQIVSRGEGR